MKCPKCSGKLRVYDSSDIGDEVYRQRECPVCGHRLYTAEFEVEPDTKFRVAWAEHYRGNRNNRKKKE